MRWNMLLILGMVACSGGGPGGMGGGRGGQKVEPVTVVEVAPAERGAVSDLLITNATIESERQADVIPQAAGIVRDLRVVEGQAVDKGEVLAVLENVSLSEASVRARTELDRLERELKATQRLYEQGAVSRADLESAQAQVTAARSTLREASVQAGNATLVAPFDGHVASRSVRLGQLAPTGQAALQVVDLDALRVVASLPERDVGRVREGQSATLISAYDPELTATATVDRIAPVIDAQTGTFQVVLSLQAGQRTLRPGQYVTVNLEVDRHEGVVVVPKKAVVYEDGAPVVYRMVDAPEPEEAEQGDEAKAEAPGGGSDFGFSFGFGGGGGAPDKKAEEAEPPSPYVGERVTIDLGLVDDTYAEINEGIAVGDQVIVVGQSNLRDGAPVKTPEMIQADEAKKDEKAKADETNDAPADGEAVDGEAG